MPMNPTEIIRHSLSEAIECTLKLSKYADTLFTEELNSRELKSMLFNLLQLWEVNEDRAKLETEEALQNEHINIQKMGRA